MKEITAKAAAKLRKKFPRIFGNTDPELFKIHPKSDTKNGQWFCAHCGECFQNNLEASGHSKSHKLVWWTGTHFEEP